MSLGHHTWVYLHSEPGLYTVGFFTPAGKWEAESDHGSREEAAARVHYLNGNGAARELVDSLNTAASALLTALTMATAGANQTAERARP